VTSALSSRCASFDVAPPFRATRVGPDAQFQLQWSPPTRIFNINFTSIVQLSLN